MASGWAPIHSHSLPVEGFGAAGSIAMQPSPGCKTLLSTVDQGVVHKPLGRQIPGTRHHLHHIHPGNSRRSGNARLSSGGNPSAKAGQDHSNSEETEFAHWILPFHRMTAHAAPKRVTLGGIEVLRCDGHHKKSLSHEPW